ncbi:hypothetical protein KGQ27_03465 [Patescibacteria group bacterium]|nr:hypothetical protein [Patescibacteria group bacterium]MDE1946911.1 hypothetical protein [Patescibacteria group bacterium]MDE2011112.1 hypothetical protein [Patescibacteria group bacterium]MDE2233196.1 hypothetical protein [Patescibacteria group bacterium]
MAKLNTYKGMVIAVGGPPHSGKSVFLAELYRLLLARRPAGVFLQRACPDGEGMWSAEADPTIVAEIRRKGNFDAGFMLFTLKAIEALGTRFPIVLVDLGGRRSAQNAEILARCSHLINLVRSDKAGEGAEWIKFASNDGCELLADFTSTRTYLPGHEGSDDPDHLDLSARSTVETGSLVALATLQNLDRGKKGWTDEQKALIRECYREAVSQFADWLIAQADSLSA